MIRVHDRQLVFLYEEGGSPVGAFIGKVVGGHLFLSWTIMSRPNALPRALAQAIGHAQQDGWPYVEFYIRNDHPRAAALARVASQYRADPFDSDEDGVFYRVTF